MIKKTSLPFIWTAIFVLVVGLACNLGSTKTQTTPTEEPAKIVETTVPPIEKPQSGAVSNLQDVRKAVIQIVAEGTFIDPEFGLMANAAGSGSGFIIDPSGIAVTNNHVVTGAAILKVYISGETKPRNAKVLGVSECSDLAVIDINGEGFSYLDWYTGDIQVGMDVYSAGFPLGDPEFTLTRGVISKAQADGESSWASVDWVIEHDATINPGNSGGPLINSDGQVVAINYALSPKARNQYFAIARMEALPVIEKLRAGDDVNSIGVNGMAVVSDDGSFSGVWVSSVQSGSVADKAGVQGGDIITALEDHSLGMDGTMADYCDIIRTHNPGDTMKITILRYSTQEVLDGQLNGRPLETAFSFFSNELSNEVPTTNAGETYTQYESYKDNTGTIQISIPVEWGDVNGEQWTASWGDYKDIVMPRIEASANLDNYNDGFDESGVFFTASDRLGQIGGFVQLLDGTKDWYNGSCRFDSRNEYEDVAFKGRYDLWVDCGSSQSVVVLLAARPINPSLYGSDFLLLVEVKITKDADLDAFDQILQSFDVVGGF